MRHRAKLLVGCLGALLGVLPGGCTALPPAKTEALGPVFNEDVKQGYVALASSQWNSGDWDFLRSDRKAEAAMLGNEVWPDRVGSRLMPAAAREEMLVQRARLVDALEASARTHTSRDAAKAQVSFDCWLGEVAASGQPDLDTGCKDIFMEQMAQIETSLRDLPDRYEVFFETGSALLSVPARNTLTGAARAARLLEPRRVEVIGLADATGGARANQALANERAVAVAQGLRQAGVPADLIRVDAPGAVGQGASAANRRVEIALVP